MFNHKICYIIPLILNLYLLSSDFLQVYFHLLILSFHSYSQQSHKAFTTPKISPTKSASLLSWDQKVIELQCAIAINPKVIKICQVYLEPISGEENDNLKAYRNIIITLNMYIEWGNLFLHALRMKKLTKKQKYTKAKKGGK